MPSLTLARKRNDWKQLSQKRLNEANALLAQSHYEGAAYLAGYSVECLLKACIAAKTTKDELPERGNFQSLYTHNLRNLLILAGLEKELDADMAKNSTLSANWGYVKDWTEEWRYNIVAKQQQLAQDLIKAIDDQTNGVAAWLNKHC